MRQQAHPDCPVRRHQLSMEQWAEQDLPILCPSIPQVLHLQIQSVVKPQDKALAASCQTHATQHP